MIQSPQMSFLTEIKIKQITATLRQPRYLGFEVLTVVVMKSTIFWDITPVSPLSVNRRFEGTYRLHLQGRKNKFSKKPA
jgi:hypothetical protein